MKQNFLIFQEIGTVKKLFTFQEIELSKLKKKNEKTHSKKMFFYFRRKFQSPKKPKFILFLQRKL